MTGQQQEITLDPASDMTDREVTLRCCELMRIKWEEEQGKSLNASYAIGCCGINSGENFSTFAGILWDSKFMEGQKCYQKFVI